MTTYLAFVMQPFLLAFVDSEAFKFMMWALLIAALAGVIGGITAFLLGARFVLQRWRQLRSASTQRERFQAAAPLLIPCAVVGLLLLFKLGSARYEAKRQNKLQASAQRIIDSLRTASIGIYTLEYPDHSTILATATGTQQQAAHAVADTAVAAEEATRPSAELTLNADSTFHYRSNIVGDATGATQQGIWRVECLFCFGRPSGNSINYQPYFYTINQYTGNYESISTLISVYEKRKLRFMGSHKQQKNSDRFYLKKLDLKISSAPQ